jgi:putative tricarboxylic transport membrane protein
MVLAQILGVMMESNFRRSMAMSQDNLLILVTRPIAVTILILAAVTTTTGIWRQRKALRQQVTMATLPPSEEAKG